MHLATTVHAAKCRQLTDTVACCIYITQMKTSDKHQSGRTSKDREMMEKVLEDDRWSWEEVEVDKLGGKRLDSTGTRSDVDDLVDSSNSERDLVTTMLDRLYASDDRNDDRSWDR